MNHKHVTHVLKVVEEALEPYDGIDMQRVSTRTENNFGSSYTHVTLEIILTHEHFEHSFEEARKLSAEAYRKEFLKILDDGA